MKILVFEYITGGGLRNESLPRSLAREGDMMLTALMSGLLQMERIKLYATRDNRLPLADEFLSAKKLSLEPIDGSRCLDSVLEEMMARCDAVWPIAPETEGILAHYCKLVEKAGKILLSSSSDAVMVAGNKIKTFECLQGYDVPLVPTFPADYEPDFRQGKWVLKPVDGVGCEGSRIVCNSEEFSQAVKKTGYIMQPYVEGRALSLSCLFYYGKARLVCCNEQMLEIVDGTFELRQCIVNINKNLQDFQPLVEQIARALPGLWGYVGIDLIETETGPVVLEINPRLTTSFAGISDALGINIAETVVDGLTKEPDLHFSCNQSVAIALPKESRSDG